MFIRCVLYCFLLQMYFIGKSVFYYIVFFLYFPWIEIVFFYLSFSFFIDFVFISSIVVWKSKTLSFRFVFIFSCLGREKMVQNLINTVVAISQKLYNKLWSMKLWCSLQELFFLEFSTNFYELRHAADITYSNSILYWL